MSSEVTIGSIWENINPTTKQGRIYRVAAQNVNTEAGPDSWLMHGQDRPGHVLYMHHNARLAGEWRSVGMCVV